jgi:DNA-binding HxlR family transcriptional regulator
MKSGYCLTEKGKSLKNVMTEIQEWADQWVCEID